MANELWYVKTCLVKTKLHCRYLAQSLITASAYMPIHVFSLVILVSEAQQTDLCQKWSKALGTSFLVTMLI